MKKILMWVFAATLICGTTAVFTSCDDDDVEDLMENINIVGKWKTTGSVTPVPSEDIDIIINCTLEFKGDGTFISVDEEGDKGTGTWLLRDRTLTMSTTEDGETITQTFNIQSDWTRDRMAMIAKYTDADEGGKAMVYTINVVMNRIK